MPSPRPSLEVRKAQLPYFRPWVVVDVTTNKIVAHCKTESEARATLRQMQLGLVSATPSAIQETGDPFKAVENRMTHPYGEKLKEARTLGQPVQRKIEL